MTAAAAATAVPPMPDHAHPRPYCGRRCSFARFLHAGVGSNSDNNSNSAPGIVFVLQPVVVLLVLMFIVQGPLLLCKTSSSSTTPLAAFAFAFVPPLMPHKSTASWNRNSNFGIGVDIGIDIDSLPQHVNDNAAGTGTGTVNKNINGNATTSTTTNNNKNSNLYGVATQLLDLVLEKRNQDVADEQSQSQSQQKQQSPLEAWIRKRQRQRTASSGERERNNRIEALIESLTRPALDNGNDGSTDTTATTTTGLFSSLLLPAQKKKRNKNPRHQSSFYDPSESLFGGGFFCTLYFYYPNNNSKQQQQQQPPPEDPIWEKTSLLPSNIKGQQYYIRNDFQQSVINYSEIWGPNFTIAAEGVLTPVTGNNDNDNDNDNNDNDNGGNLKTNSRTLRRLPDVFRVDATQISVSLSGLFRFDFDIKGSANLVVLYADPRLRVFVSPLPSNTVVGNWEEAGLVVVQVRSDLVPTKNTRTPRILDLR